MQFVKFALFGASYVWRQMTRAHSTSAHPWTEHIASLVVGGNIEKFAVAFFDAKGEFIGGAHMFDGTEDLVQVDIAALLSRALQLNARRIVVAHNHPNGNLSPSEKDIKFARRLMLATTIIGISLDDSLIVSESGIYSMRDDGPWPVPLDEYVALMHVAMALHLSTT